MNPQSMLMFLFMAFAAIAWWTHYSTTNKILVYFNRADKTQIVRWEKLKTRYVMFDGKKFNVIPARIVYRRYDGGLFYKIFPQRVPTLFYSWNSPYPHDPNSLEFNSETPEMRFALNKTEWVESYYKGAKPSTKPAGKFGFLSGGLMGWLPIVAIILVVGVAWYLNSKMQGFGQTLDAVIGKLNELGVK